MMISSGIIFDMFDDESGEILPNGDPVEILKFQREDLFEPDDHFYDSGTKVTFRKVGDRAKNIKLS